MDGRGRERTGFVRFGAWFVGWLAAYLLAAVVSRWTYASELPVAVVWPAAGVALAWAATGGLRRLPWVALGVAVPMVLHGISLDGDPAGVIAFASAHALQAVVVGGLWLAIRRRTGRPPWLEDARDLLALVLCALAGAAVTVPLMWWGSVVLYGDVPAALALGWVARNAASTLVVGVLLLEVVRARDPDVAPTARPSTRELLALAAAVVTVGVLLSDRGLATAVPFVVFTFLVWVGSQLAPPYAAGAVVVLVGLSAAALVRGDGSFALVEDPLVRVTMFQVFGGLGVLMSLVLSYVGRERVRLAAQLADAHRESSRQARMLSAVAGAMSEDVLVYDERRRLVWSNTVDRTDPSTQRFEAVDGGDLPHEEHPAVLAFAGEPVTRARFARTAGTRRAVLEVDASLIPGSDETGSDETGSDETGSDETGSDETGSRLAVLVVRDVTDEHHQVEQLQAFAGSVAHDLKTPLAGVLGYARMAQEELAEMAGSGAEVTSVLRLVDRSEAAGHRMEQLIRDLLDLSASDRTSLHLTRLDLVALAAQVAGEVGEAHPDLRVSLPAGPVHVEVEPRLVRQLLLNVVGNAVKYARDGERPEVDVSASVAGDRVLVAVADRGVGIPAGEEGMVFEPFRRATNRGEVGGSGLGLAICARAVERHGGRITAAPNPEGRGTVITFDLPVAAAAPSARAPVGRAPASRDAGDSNRDLAP